MIEQSYVMVKPGFANEKWIVEEIKRRLEEKQLKVVESSYVKYDIAKARKHYQEHYVKYLDNPKSRAFYPELEEYIISDKAYGMVVVGENAIAAVRELVGTAKNPDKGTIRYDIPEMIGMERNDTKNVVHASGKSEEAKQEIEIFEELSKSKKTDLGM